MEARRRPRWRRCGRREDRTAATMRASSDEGGERQRRRRRGWRRRGWRRPRGWRERRGWLLTLTLTLTRVRSRGFSRRSHSEHPALKVSRRTCGSVRRHDWRVIRRPASSPTRLRAHWPTARFDRATSPAARRHSSVPPPPPCSRLERSTGPGGGQAARARRASGVAAEPRARSACAPAARACAQATRRGGGVLRPFERCSGSRGGGWWSVAVRKKLSAGFPESGEVSVVVFVWPVHASSGEHISVGQR